MSTQHTPGPWAVCGSKAEGLSVRAGHAAICILPGYGLGYRVFNAHLIAAAPSLLEALKDLVASNADERIHAAIAAIDKAEGR